MRYYIVDDNIATIKTLENIIKSRQLGTICGYCTDPIAAVSEILEDRPDIVLVDLLMNGMDGISLVKKIKEANPGISFVMISKVSDKDMIQRAYSAGIEFFINKPVHLVEVETVLKNVAEKVKMANMVDNIKNMFDIDAQGEANKQESRKADSGSIEPFLGMMGMLGEKGTADIKRIFEIMQKSGSSYNKEVLARVAKEKEDTVINVEQRVRRAIKKGLANAANAGLDDYAGELFDVYAAYVFDFKTLKDEMNYITGKTSAGGRVSIARFMEGLQLYHKSL